jgi:glycogen phosphorylase
MNKISVPKLPKRIQGLNELAYNLWWSWHPEARHLFKSLDRAQWKSTLHNPVKLLNHIAPFRLASAAADKDFLKRYDQVMSSYKQYMLSPDYQMGFSADSHLVAYFSMEFAIHSSLPIYAGGLGVLAGDYCKEASDIGLPLVGVGFMYPQGYFQQHITEDGWQQEKYTQINFADTPITPILDAGKTPLKIKVELESRIVYVAVWQVNVGKTRLYLLDTHLEENSPTDRELTARLYGGNGEIRLQQEIILGIGGVRMLRALQIYPSAWHANEGHASFMMLERCRERVQAGESFIEAQKKVQAATVFTTHTPVPAGNDAFPQSLVETYFQGYWNYLGLDRNNFLALGTQPCDGYSFNMTVLGMRMANFRNGVSELHGAVCRRMWHGLWPEVEETEVPVTSITNGIHVPTWISPQMSQLYDKYLEPGWTTEQDKQATWDNIKQIPHAEMWENRRRLKSKLADAIREGARQCWTRNRGSSGQAIAMGALFDPDILTIGFCRRFTEYKRAWLVLRDINRLKRILCNETCPVQIVFAGKAHPNDDGGKRLIRQVFNYARDPEMLGRIIFVEDYDLHKARYLVHGVDLWLNTPRPLQEASGTSGMKTALNGVLNLSVLDGWWYEGYNGANGWAVHTKEPEGNLGPDDSDADEIYSLLENTIVPLYYDRDRSGVPQGWVRMLKEAIRSCAPAFSARRMLKDYIEQMYIPAISAGEIDSFNAADTESSKTRV